MDISNFLGYTRVPWSFLSSSNSHLTEYRCQWHITRRKYNLMAMNYNHDSQWHIQRCYNFQWQWTNLLAMRAACPLPHRHTRTTSSSRSIESVASSVSTVSSRLCWAAAACYMHDAVSARSLLLLPATSEILFFLPPQCTPCVCMQCSRLLYLQQPTHKDRLIITNDQYGHKDCYNLQPLTRLQE
jgi:hypothetical protein